MAFLYLYSLAGFACLKLVTPDFGLLANTEYRLEGAFRCVACPQLVNHKIGTLTKTRCYLS